MRFELAGDGYAYMRDINGLTDAEAKPWHVHPVYGDQGASFQPADASFRHVYGDID